MFSRRTLSIAGETRDFTMAPEPVSVHTLAILEELRFVRREAQAEADIAYDSWGENGDTGCYAVYRAAQDRADAAQDDLARCAQAVACAG